MSMPKGFSKIEKLELGELILNLYQEEKMTVGQISDYLRVIGYKGYGLNPNAVQKYVKGKGKVRTCSERNALSVENGRRKRLSVKPSKKTRLCDHCGSRFAIGLATRRRICIECAPDGVSSKRVRMYGITKKEFDNLLASQENKCPVCLQMLEGDINIDHDHKTLKVRGILHSKCNLLLGQVEARTTSILNALSYLKRSSDDLTLDLPSQEAGTVI